MGDIIQFRSRRDLLLQLQADIHDVQWTILECGVNLNKLPHKIRGVQTNRRAAAVHRHIVAFTYLVRRMLRPSNLGNLKANQDILERVRQGLSSDLEFLRSLEKRPVLQVI